jgi:hypothetical protein
MGFKSLVFLATIVLFLSGCAAPPTVAESNRAADWNGQIRRLYVQVTYQPEFGRDFSDALEDRLTRVFTECGVTVKVVRLSSLDLDNRQALSTELRRFEADSVLTISPTGGGLNQDNVIVNRNFASRLIILPNRTIWRGNFKVFTGGSLTTERYSDRGNAFGIELTNRMKSDRLLGSCAPLTLPRPTLK